MSGPKDSELPVASRLAEILTTLESARRVVLSAEPGAGKSTLVPKALLESRPGKILVLEPRRVAAKMLATYVSRLAGSALGQEIGYHVRFDRKTSEHTRLVYLTEGLLRRYIQSDPFLSGVDTVVIDEFHERSMNADVGLMLLRKIQDELRPDLRILVMSATLDAAKASAYLHDAPIIQVPGRGFPVHIAYAQKIQDPFDLEEISAKVTDAVHRLLKSPDDDGGHILVFLPGQREIRAVQETLSKSFSTISGAAPSIYPLYSQLPENEIRDALESRKGQRKIILATNIAESSLTLDGLTAVVDSGLQRRSNISSTHLVPFLETARISRASAEQRAGRAGRQAPGRAVRLWSESEHRFLQDFETPEIQRSDPSQEILSLLDIGFASCTEIPWLDPPPAETLSVVAGKLRSLQLIERSQDSGHETLTPLAHACLETSIELRWALFLEHLLLDAGYVDERSLLRACSSELGPRDKDGDLESVVDLRTAQLRASASYRALKAALGNRFRASPVIDDDVVLRALSKAFLDRLARLRNNSDSDKALMWGQRGLRLPQRARAEIHREDFLLAFDLDDSQHSNEDSRLRVYRWLPRKMLETLFAARIREKTWAEKDSKTGVLRFWRAKFLDDFAIQDPIPATPDPTLLREHRNSEVLNSWKDLAQSETSLGQLLRRLSLWQRAPNPTDIAKALATMESLPADATEIAGSESFIEAIENLFTYKELSELNSLFPRALSLPRGRQRPLDYRNDGRVFLSVRLPDLFGLKEHPSIDKGRIKIHLEILSPAGRPWQITQDLPNFWRSSYLEIRKEMKARYPRQPWPDNPAEAFE